MALVYEKNQYAIPRGRVFFNPQDTATDAYLGEIYLGNCPGFTVSIETEKAEHYSSETGLRQKDDSTVLEVKRSAKIDCDNMNAANQALFLSGTQGTQTQAAGAATDEALTVIPGRTYQLGVSSLVPVGRRMVSTVTVKSSDSTTTYAAGTDYVLDADRGILQILKAGTIVAGAIKVSYSYAACTWDGIRSGANGSIRGALRVAADNAKGTNLDYYLPLCDLAPSGDLAAIADGTDYNKMSFDVEVLKPANAEAIYLDGQPVAA